jgi:hypothetical protein
LYAPRAAYPSMPKCSKKRRSSVASVAFASIYRTKNEHEAGHDQTRALGRGGIMAASDIAWTEATWNPLAGCKIVSPGGANGDALRMVARLQAMGMNGRGGRAACAVIPNLG